MMRVVRWTSWLFTTMAWLGWIGIYLPSRVAYDYDLPIITHSLWGQAASILNHLEPLSRGIQSWILPGILSVALMMSAVSLVVSGWRFFAMITLWLVPITGLPWLYYVYPVIRDGLQGFVPRGTLDNKLLEAFQLFPAAFYKTAKFFVIPFAASFLALVVVSMFWRQLVTAPLRQGHIRRSTAPTKWMDAKTERKLQSPGLTLGRKGRRILYYPYTNPEFYGGHHFAFAGTRGGKGVSVIVPGLVDHDGPTSTIDIKGENWIITRRWRQQKGYRVLALNPFGVFEPSQVGLNLFDFLRPEFLSDDAKLIATALIREENNDVGAHLVDLARKLVAAVIEVVHTVDDPANHHIITVYNLILGDTAKKAFAVWAANPQLCGGRPARAVGAFLGKDDKEFNHVKSTISRNLSFLDGDRMQAFITTSGLKPADILSGNVDIFTIVPLEHLADQANLLRLISALQLNTILSSPHRRLSKPLLMVLDEFPALGAMEQMKNLFTVGAGSNLIVLGITQDLSRLQNVWGRDAALSMLSQCATLRVFGLGAGDSATAEWTERLMPEIAKKRENTTYKADSISSDHISYSDATERLITAEDILRMGMSKMLCIVRGKNPLQLDRIISYDDSAYSKKVDRSPYL